MSDAGGTMYQCPFCDTETPATFCPACGRNRTTPRQVCRACSRMTPKGEAECSHCGAKQVNELARKIPLIIAIFAVTIAVSVTIRLFVD